MCHNHNHFPGPPGWAGARRELLDFYFMVQGEIYRDTDHLAARRGRHSIQTNQYPPPPSPHNAS